MAQILKVSTAYTFRIGPFVDSTDGFTPETALTIDYTDCLLSKAGAAFAAKADTTNLTSTGTAQGYYTCVLNTTDTGTVGALRVHIYVSGALPVWRDFQVVNAVTYDSLFSTAGADYLQVDLAQINSVAVNAGTAQLGVNVVNFGGSAGTFASGRPEVNTTYFGGSAGTFASGRPEVNTTHFGGTAGTFASGRPQVNASHINSVAATSVTTINANLGTTQPVNFTGTAGSATVKSDVTNIATAAVSTTTAQVGANIVQVATDPVIASSSKTTNWGGTP